MIEPNDIKRFSKKNSSGFTIYITDDELYSGLLEAIENKTDGFSLIPTIWGNDGKYYYEEYPFTDFLELRKRGIWFFYVNNREITPNIISGKADYTWEVNFAFNGLIRIHQDKVEGKKVRDCFVSILASVIDESSGEIIRNEEYQFFFNKLKEIIGKKLVHKSLFVNPAGKEFVSKKADVTAGYANQIRNGEIDSIIKVA